MADVTVAADPGQIGIRTVNRDGGPQPGCTADCNSSPPAAEVGLNAPPPGLVAGTGVLPTAPTTGATWTAPDVTWDPTPLPPRPPLCSLTGI